MISRKEDRDHYWGSAVFIVLFFLLISAFSDKSEGIFDKVFQYKTISYSYLLAQHTPINDAQQITCQKEITPFITKEQFTLLNDCNKLIAVNRSLHHCITHLQEAEVLIKPLIVHRFYYQYHSIDTDEFSLLS